MIEEYPKFVTPDASHIHRDDSGRPISCNLFPGIHVDRDTEAVTVLVSNAEEEAIALAPHVEPAADEPAEVQPEPAVGPAADFAAVKDAPSVVPDSSDNGDGAETKGKLKLPKIPQ